MKKNFYNLSVLEITTNFKTDQNNGLTVEQAEVLLNEIGLNQLMEKKAISPWKMFFDQFKDFIVLVLIGAAVVSGFLGEWIDAAAIIGIVIINAILGFIQEYKAEKSLANLKKLSSPTTKVIRNGQRHSIPSSHIVPGDLIEVEAGDSVPADCRLVWVTSNFNVQEASLTGESVPVSKKTNEIQGEMSLGDRINMVYMGTAVTSGRAKAIVVLTAMSTELGKIAGMLQEEGHEATPLQKKLEEFGKWIVYICFILVALVFAMEYFRGGELIETFLTAVSLAVAAIPEGLPAVVTIALALGVHRMVKRNAIIRKLPSVETLGCATVICSDKTGTLTKNEMTVQAVYAGGDLFSVTGIGYEPKGDFLKDGKSIDANAFSDLKQTLLCSILCNNSEIKKRDKGFGIVGDPTEGSLVVAAEKAGINKSSEEKKYSFLEEIPFDSDRKMMSVIRKNNDLNVAYIKGAPDVILKGCVQILDKGKIRPITEQDRHIIQKINNDFTNQAMRVLGLASHDLDAQDSVYQAETVEKDMTFLGLMAMIDPAREEVKTAVAECHKAGIKVVMITGDHKNTAVAIAKQLGFYKADSKALTGEELDQIDDATFLKDVEHIPVFARVSPEHKLRIVKAWRRRGEVVAMTGDGVNDAPAVKEADIGVAMGITGTDVTKEVSDMVVADDNFASIVSAVEEGRGIYDNIKKFVHYLLSCNIGEILVMFVASLIGLPAPLLPIHILWVNLVTDSLPALALGIDPVDPNIMQRAPRNPKESVLNKERGLVMIMQGTFIAICSLSAFCFVMYVENEGIERARTAAFIVLACSQLFHSFNCRSMTSSLFKLGVFTNIKLVWATLISFALQMAVVYLPFANIIFKTQPLSLFDWCFVLLISSFPLIGMEIVKRIKPFQPLLNRL